ncbi:MAG: flagellin, partial [Candidatus Eremiobacteraeota bacterium]|nr:flagellin [Candidatus Eremiobacteraeota bacterium]
MAQGLSIANNLLANSVQFNLNNNQSALKNIVTQLSSGLRINSAADDPSGLAIATNLQTQVDGF